METISATGKMLWGDYITVCIRQMRMSEGKPQPKNFLEVFEGPLCATPDEYQPAANMADELFGKWPSEGTGELLFNVDELTIRESAIARRMDLTHREKVELVRPLRAMREAQSDRYHRCQAGSRVAPVPAPQTFEQRIGEADVIRALGMGIKLD